LQVKSPGLRAFLGSDFSTEALKPIGLRARNTLKPWLIRQPQRAMSERLTTRDGRDFKLLRYAPSILDRRDRAAHVLGMLSKHPSVPRLVWSDERNLLVEWIEGSVPRADDAHFARRLGEAFAELYRVGSQAVSRAQSVAPFLDHLRDLMAAERLPGGSDARFAAQLDSALPETVPTGMLCGDQTLANFVLDEDGSLYMIDPGSFQTGLPVDLFLVGAGGLYASIDRNAFHEGYAHANGIDFPFLHAEPLAWLQAARQTALQCRVLDTTSWLEPRRKRSLQRRVEQGLETLRRLLG
jgi:hypothetical protein